MYTTPLNKRTASISQHIDNVTCDALNPWIRKDLEGFATVHIDDYLEYILERCLQPGKAVKQTEGDGTPLVKAVYSKIIVALENHKKEGGQICFNLNNYANTSKETDRYAPWVEATNVALQILKSVIVDDIRGPSDLNILAQRNDPNEVPISHGTDKSFRKPDVVFVTEDELVKMHGIDKNASKWRTLLYTRCQTRLPTNTAGWRQFKATFEFKRKKSNNHPRTMAIPKGLRPCRPGMPGFIEPQKLGVPAPAPEGAAVEPVPKASSGKEWVLGSTNTRHAKTVDCGELSTSAGPTHRARAILKCKEPMVQAAGYAAEIMSKQTMTHTHGCVIEDTVMWCWWYDRQGVIQTSGFDFMEDSPRFLVLLFAWQRFTEEDWGVVPLGQPGQTFTCDGGVEITLAKDQDLIHRPYGIIGRGTTVLRATSKSGPLKDVPLVVKFSCQEESRTPETEILDAIHRRASHLPVVADHVLQYTTTKSTAYSTSHIRERLKLDTKGARKLTIIVFEELEGHISELDGTEMWEVGYQLYKCNCALWKLGIQHRDISPLNMMFKRIDGGIRGYLIDFDLASLVDRDSHNLDRTGTVPFMALELLQSVRTGLDSVVHTFAHDAEAVCWVILWLGVQYAAGKRVRRSFEGWEMVDAWTCYQAKLALLGALRLHPFTKPNERLQEPIRGLVKKFGTYNIHKIMIGGEVPVPDTDGWMEECDQAIRAQDSISEETQGQAL